MSGHLIGCAGAIKGLGKSHKLALLAFADSGDDRTHIGFPGYEGVQMWADCSRSRAAELISDLVAAGYLELHKSARPGRRAEYIVFPDGCCDLHRTPAVEATDVDLEAIAKAAGIPLEHAAAFLAAMNNGSDTPDPNGSEISDPSSGNGSEISDPSSAAAQNGSETSDSNSERVQNGSEISDPSTTSRTTTPLPPASGWTAPQRTCPKHPDAPGANCRACGTTARQVADQRRREAAEQRRRTEQARHRREQEQLARRSVPTEQRSPDVVAALAAVRKRPKTPSPAGARR